MIRSLGDHVLLGWILPTLLLLPTEAEAAGDRNEIVVGFRETITSKVLKEDRTLEISLPDNFAESKESYPVLVVLDGGWYFRYVISVVDMMSPNYMPRMIVVGLPNTDRRRDLDPKGSAGKDGSSGPDLFLRFLSDELLPHLEKKYRASDYRVLTGHSLAGYFTLYSLFEAPDLFDAYISSSPSLGNPERLELILGELNTSDVGARDGKFLFFSAGGNEPEELHRNHRALERNIENKGGEMKIQYEIFEDEGHVPTKAFYAGIRGVFPNWIPSLDFFRNGDVADMKRHYGALSKNYGIEVLPPQPIINSVGRRLLREADPEGAAEVYEFFVSVYPESVDAHLALAEIQVILDLPEAAAASARRALALDPGNRIALELLKIQPQ